MKHLPSRPGRTRATRAKIAVLGMAMCVALAGCAQTPPANAVAPAPGTAPAVLFTSCSRPVYPEQALARKIEGTVTIGFLVGPNGKVKDSKLYTSSGDASLDEAARSAIAKCTFTAPTRQGKPVEAWVPVQYVWKAD